MGGKSASEVRHFLRSISNTYEKVVGDVELFEATQLAYAGRQFAELVGAYIPLSIASRQIALTKTEMCEIGNLEQHTGQTAGAISCCFEIKPWMIRLTS